MTRRVDLTDSDNPEWTPADFARGVGPEGLSDVEAMAFPRSNIATARRQIVIGEFLTFNQKHHELVGDAKRFRSTRTTCNSSGRSAIRICEVIWALVTETPKSRSNLVLSADSVAFPGTIRNLFSSSDHCDSKIATACFATVAVSLWDLSKYLIL